MRLFLPFRQDFDGGEKVAKKTAAEYNHVMADIFAYSPKAKLAGTCIRLPKVRLFLNGSKTEILMADSGFDDMCIGSGGIAVITTLTSSNYSPVCGSSVTLTATLIGVFGFGLPTGTITFYSGTTALGSGTVTGGVVAISLSSLPAGTNTIHAVYSGDVHYLPSTSVSITVTVSNIATTTLLVDLPNPSGFGQPVALIAEVTPIPASPIPVNFFIDTSLVGVGHTDGLGIAFTTTTAMTVGDHQVYAQFTGGACYAASISNTVTQTVLTSISSSSLSSSSSSLGCWLLTISGVANFACTDCASLNGTFILNNTGNDWTAEVTVCGNMFYQLAFFGGPEPFWELVAARPDGSVNAYWVLLNSAWNPNGANVMTLTERPPGNLCLWPNTVTVSPHNCGPVLWTVGDTGTGHDSASVSTALTFSDSGVGVDIFGSPPITCPPMACAMDAYLCDKFGGPYGTPLGSHVMDIGPGWINTSDFQIRFGFVSSTSAGAGSPFANAGVHDNITMTCCIAGTSFFGLVWCSDGSNNYFFTYSASGIVISKNVGGVITTLGSVSITLTAGEWNNFQIDKHGTTIDLTVNGTPLLTVNDSGTLLTGTNFGLLDLSSSVGSPVAEFANFEVVPRVPSSSSSSSSSSVPPELIPGQTNAAQTDSDSGGHITVNWPSATTIGNLLVVWMETTGNPSDPTTPTGWTLANSLPTGASLKGYIFFRYNAPSISSLVFSIPIDATTVKYCVAEFMPGSLAGTVDQTASASGTGNVGNSGTTPNTTQAVELAMTLIASDQSLEFVDAPTNGFVDLAPDAIHSVMFAYKILSATGAQTCGATVAGSSPNWVGCIATIK